MNKLNINLPTVGSHIYTDGASLYLPFLLNHVLTNGGSLQYREFNGSLVKDVNEVHAWIKDHGGRLFSSTKDSYYIYIWDDSAIYFSYNKKTSGIAIACHIANEKLFEEIEAFKDFISTSKKNLVYSIIKDAYGLTTKSLGDASTILNEDNYNASVIEGFKHVVSAFSENPPHGRIVIMNGEPGTGKTHLIRSLFSELDCLFLILPSSMIDVLDKPDFLPLLIKTKELHEKPIILIIEDGDTCLTPRKIDNMSLITSLLNLSDGILGSIFDIRVVITTNAYVGEIDKAIMRPGRLCKQINVDPLPYEQANKVYKRLTKDEKASLPSRKEYILAEIYERANNKDKPNEVFVQQEQRTIGFRMPDHSSESEGFLNKKE